MAQIENTVKTILKLDTNEVQQKLVEFNNKASDATNKLTDRVAAKNVELKVSEGLSKRLIKAQEKEIEKLESNKASVKTLQRANEKLNRIKITAIKNSGKLAKQQNTLSNSLTKSRDNMTRLDVATGGLVTKMKLLATNPIAIVIGALVGIFQLLKKAMGATEDGAGNLNVIFAAFNQIITSVVKVLSNILAPIIKKIADFIINDLNPNLEAMGGFFDAIKVAVSSFADAIKLSLTPLRGLIALTKAAALAIKGDFGGAKKVMEDFKNETIDAANSVKDKLVKAYDLAADAAENYDDNVKNATGSTDNLISRAAKLADLQVQFNKDKRAQLVADAKLGIKAREALAAAKDATTSLADRFIKLKEFAKIEEDRAIARVNIAKQELDIALGIAELGKNSKEDNDEIAQLTIVALNAQEKLANQKLIYNRYSKEFIAGEIAFFKQRVKAEVDNNKIIVERNSLQGKDTFNDRIKQLEFARDAEIRIAKETARITGEDEVAVNQKYDLEIEALKVDRRLRDQEANVDAAEIELERKRYYRDITLEDELAFLTKQMELELSQLELSEEEKANIRRKFQIEQAKAEDDYAKNKTKLQKIVASKEYQGAKLAANAITSIADDLFEDNKVAKIASIGISTATGAFETFAITSAAYPTPYGSILGAISAAAIVAGGIKAIRDVKAVKKGSTSSPSSGSIAPTGISTSAVKDLTENNADRRDSSIVSNATADASNNVQQDLTQNIVFSESKYQDFKGQVNFKESKTGI